MDVGRKTLSIGGGSLLALGYSVCKWIVPWIWGAVMAKELAPLHAAIDSAHQVNVQQNADIGALFQLIEPPRDRASRQAYWRIRRRYPVGPEDNR